jgi:hypothetical protein
MKGSGAFRWVTIALATSVVILDDGGRGAGESRVPARACRQWLRSGARARLRLHVSDLPVSQGDWLCQWPQRGQASRRKRLEVRSEAARQQSGAVRRSGDVQEWVTSGCVDVRAGHVANRSRGRPLGRVTQAGLAGEVLVDESEHEFARQRRACVVEVNAI